MTMRARRADRSGVFSGNKPERAIIDIGSNTVRLVVYGGNMRAPMVLLNEKVVARLGRDLAITGRIPDEAIAIAMRGLRRYVLLLRELGVEDVETVATAAARDAENGAEFIAEVKALGLSPRLISGDEEARLSAHGVIGAFPGRSGIAADLGGGSLELVAIADGASGRTDSLPLGTLRLLHYRQEKRSEMRKSLGNELSQAGWNSDQDGDGDAPLFLVGGTWRSMAVYAMEQGDNPLTDPHGFELDRTAAMALAKELAKADPPVLRAMERISSMRSAIMPDAAVLLQAMIKQLQPSSIVFSSWGLREGLLYDRLAEHERAQDPLLAGVAHFSTQRGAPPVMATRIAGWTSSALPKARRGSERLRLAAAMLALASMQIEPNLRLRQGMDWALHKRWVAIDGPGRAMLAAAVAGNGNHGDLPGSLAKLADDKALEEAYCWGLATRLARRIGARSQHSLRLTRLVVVEDSLILRLAESHRDLFGIPNEKDMGLLAGRLGLDWRLETVPDDALLDEGEDAPAPSATERSIRLG